jgi:RNase P protein component
LRKTQGQPRREISRLLKVSRNRVRRVLREPGRADTPPEDPRIQAIVALLPDL